MTIADVVPVPSSRSTRGRTPLYAIQINGETTDITVQSATVTLGEGQHDQAVIKASSPTMDDTDGLIDSPISFRWGASPRIETFHGYIMDVKEDKAQGGTVSISFTMSVLGVTKAMFDGTPKFWSNKSVPSAVQDLAAKNSLGYAGHDHSHVWSSLAQTIESDWAVANSFTNRLGWSLFNRYGVLMCYDPLKLFTESGIFAQLVMGGTGINLETERVLLDFQPMEESEVLNANLGRRFGYFTSNNEVQIISQPGDYRGYVFGSEVVIRDQDAAAVYIAAADTDIDRWQQYALARVWGDSDLYPGMCVEIVSTNKQYLKTKYDGKWLIRSTSHSLDRQSYQAMLSLARPKSTTTVQVPPYHPFWQDSGNAGRSKPALTLDRSVAADSLPPSWQSSWSERSLASIL